MSLGTAFVPDSVRAGAVISFSGEQLVVSGEGIGAGPTGNLTEADEEGQSS